MENKEKEKALAFFMTRMNCAQSVAMAFANQMPNIDISILEQVTRAMGRGMGHSGEVCGALNGATIVLGGTVSKRDGETDDEFRRRLYGMEKRLVEKFRSRCGASSCALLLKKKDVPIPDGNDSDVQFYIKRPCAKLVAIAVECIQEIFELEKENSEADTK